ncbi:MAG: hypothetical protein RL033_4933 [Pseudomonadota bacterium]
MYEASQNMPSPGATVATTLMMVLGALACSSFDGGSDVLAQPALDPMTAQMSLAGANWSCLGPARATSPPVTSGRGRVVYSMQVVDITTRLTPSGVRARACNLLDVECSQPLGDWVPADEQGWVDLTLSKGFVGFLEFMIPGFVPGTFYPGEPVEESTTLNYPVLPITPDALVTLAGALDIAIDPQLGFLAVRSFDCAGVPATDVVFSKEGPGDRWYLSDGLPSVTATSTGSEGYGGYVNVPLGLTSIDVMTPTGRSISGSRSLVVRPAWFSSMFVLPPGIQIAPP